MGLHGFETPKKVTLVLDEWIPESGLVTASMKLKRKVIEAFYSTAINDMYKRENSSRYYLPKTEKGQPDLRKQMGIEKKLKTKVSDIQTKASKGIIKKKLERTRSAEPTKSGANKEY